MLHLVAQRLAVNWSGGFDEGGSSRSGNWPRPDVHTGFVLRHRKCHRYVYFFPFARFPLPLAKRFHGARIQRRRSCRLDHYYFAHRTCGYIQRDSKQAASSNMPRPQFIRIIRSAFLDCVSHPRHRSDVIASSMPNSLRIHCTRKGVTTLLSPERERENEHDQ